MSAKILVAYSTYAGSTEEVAMKIGETLRAAGARVDVMPAAKVRDVSSYQSVIIGSAIRAGQLRKDVITLAQRNRAALAKLPVAYFVVCLTMTNNTPENRATVTEYFKPLRAIKEPVSVGMFAGKIEYAKLSPFFRFIFSRAKPDELQEGDYRDWNAIRTWTQSLIPAMC